MDATHTLPAPRARDLATLLKLGHSRPWGRGCTSLSLASSLLLGHGSGQGDPFVTHPISRVACDPEEGRMAGVN